MPCACHAWVLEGGEVVEGGHEEKESGHLFSTVIKDLIVDTTPRLSSNGSLNKMTETPLS